MKTLCKFFIALAIIMGVAVAAKVIANCTDMSFEMAYYHISTFIIGVCAYVIADRMINKITDKHE